MIDVFQLHQRHKICFEALNLFNVRLPCICLIVVAVLRTMLAILEILIETHFLQRACWKLLSCSICPEGAISEGQKTHINFFNMDLLPPP